MKHIFWLILAVLVITAVSSVVFSYFYNPDSLTQMPFGIITNEKISPYDHIKEEQIHVYQDKVVIDIKNPFWARFANTNSMDPIIDINSNSIEIKPKSEEQIHVGDIISYKYQNDFIIHRVIHIGEDQEGTFYLTKGDNLTEMDPIKVRFDQINGIVVAVVY